MWSALPFVIGAIICFAIHYLNTARLRTLAHGAEQHVPAE
jgi:hypothetical protein